MQATASFNHISNYVPFEQKEKKNFRYENDSAIYSEDKADDAAKFLFNIIKAYLWQKILLQSTCEGSCF